MAIRFDVIGEGAKRTTNIVAGGADYTAMCWYRATAGFSDRPVLSQINAGVTQWAGIYNNAAGFPFLYASDGATDPFNDGPTSKRECWQHYTYTRTGSTHTWYINGFLIGSFTLDLSAAAFTEVRIGDEGLSTPTNNEVVYYREWTAVLTPSEILAERDATAAVRLTNLLTDTPLTADLLDDSGNGNDWTAIGAPSFVSDPTLADIPKNTCANAATELAAGTIAQQVDDGAATYDVWYKSTNAGAVDLTYSAGWWDSLVVGGYHPDLFIYNDAIQSIIVADGFPGGSLTIPVPAGKTWYWKFHPNPAGNFIPSTLNLKIVIGPFGLAQAGDVFIRSASISQDQIDAGMTGLVAGFVNTAACSIRGFIDQFITGETGDILPTTSRMQFADEAGSLSGDLYPDYRFYLFDPDFGILSFVDFASPSVPPKNRTHLPTEKFYMFNPGGGANPAKYQTVDAAGTAGVVVTMTGSTLGCRAIAVNNAETILYQGYLDGKVKRWDMAGGVYLTDLAGAVANYRVTDILVLIDDSIVVCYYKATAATDMYVKRYSAAGAVLNTYTFTFAAAIQTGLDPRLGYSANPDAFVLLNHLVTGKASIRKVEASTGTILVACDNVSDVNQSNQEQADPDLPMISDSCPIIELRIAEAPTTGTVIVIKDAGDDTTTPFDISVGGGLSPAEITLAGGESETYENVTPGDGYSVSEIPPPGWTLAGISVSNGSPSDNISVAAGETVTVIVTNVPEVPPPECPGEVTEPRIDGLPYVPPVLDPCAGTGRRGAPRIGARAA